jgi:taurine transport system permease protein
VITSRPAARPQARRRLRARAGRLLLKALPFAAIVCFWMLFVALGVLPHRLFPEPYQLPGTFVQLVTGDQLLEDVGVTLVRVLVAGVIGIAAAIAAGAVVSLSSRLADLLQTFIYYLQGIGEIGWLPIIILWLGFNSTTIVVTVAYTVFFPVFFGTTEGFANIPHNLRDSIRTLGGGRLAVAREVVLPGALPSIITGVRTGMGFGWRTVILAELLVGGRGLGVVLFQASESFHPAWIMVEMAVIGVVWLLLDAVLLVPLERRTINRWGLVR